MIFLIFSLLFTVTHSLEQILVSVWYRFEAHLRGYLKKYIFVTLQTGFCVFSRNELGRNLGIYESVNHD